MKRLMICFLMVGYLLMVGAEVRAAGGEIDAAADAVVKGGPDGVGAFDERREKSFKRLEGEGKKHVKMWTGSNKVDKLDLFMAGQKQTSGELKLIYKIAKEERRHKKKAEDHWKKDPGSMVDIPGHTPPDLGTACLLCFQPFHEGPCS